jgi:hypothetical protein
MTDHNPARSPLRVLIVGAGRRVQNNFFPSLMCLADSFEIAGLHARTDARMVPVAARWNVKAVRSLKDFDLGTVDVVAISVPTSQNAPVIEQLVREAPRLALVVDTPIASNRREHSAVRPLLRRFKQVVVAEDYMNFPHFTLLRTAVRDGLIGKPSTAMLYNIGYAYHGLALIRSMAGFRAVTGTSRTSVRSFSSIITYRLGHGYRACVIGPYRRQHNGGIILEGSRGVITEGPDDVDQGDPAHRPIFMLSKVNDNGLITGFAIDGTNQRLYQVETPEIALMAKMEFPDKSEINLMRSWGLIQVFRALIEADNINLSYGYENALYDSFISRLARRGLLPFDPMVLLGKNVMTAINAVSRVI